MAEDETIELLKKISEDIGAIKRYSRFQARAAILNTLNKVATTPERQEMWRLADGTLNNEQIANQIGVTLRSVQYFMQEAENAGLVTMVRRGFPKRLEEIIPPEWKPWKPKSVQIKAERQPQETKLEVKEERPDVKS